MAELGKNVGNFQNFVQFIKSLESIILHTFPAANTYEDNRL